MGQGKTREAAPVYGLSPLAHRPNSLVATAAAAAAAATA